MLRPHHVIPTLILGLFLGSLGHAQEPDMRQLLEGVRERTPTDNLYLGTRDLRRYQEWLAQATPQTPPAQVALAMQSVGIAQLRLGQENEAVQTLGKAFQMARSAKVKPEQLGEALFFLGLAYLRYGETQNCCLQHNPDSCILPLRGGGLHSKPEGSRNAMMAFSQVLKILNPQQPRYHSARWLLNIAAMTVGAYPDELPEAHRVRPELVSGNQTFPRFPNIAPQAGLATLSLAGGAIVDDLNGDHYLDIMISNWDTSTPLVLFLNNQDGTFRRVQKEAKLDGQYGGLNLVHADFNNDGNKDILVLRGAWLAENGRHPNSLLRNDGPNQDGVPQFTDVTIEMGLAKVHYPTQTADWADFDLDGDLDLFIGNETTDDIKAPCQLFRNDGDRFINVAAAAGVENLRFTKGVVWGDIDGDRYPDLYLSNMDEPNRLYRNLGNGKFRDVTEQLGAASPRRSFPTWVWDADNNGKLDAFTPFFSPDAGLSGSYYFGFKTQDEHRPGHYLNREGALTNVANQSGLDLPTMPMGCNYGDLNNDGWLDFYLGTGNVGLENITPNLMFLSKDGATFENVTLGGGFGHLQKGHSIAFADLDNDGDLDIFAQMGGAFPVDRYYDALFENPGFGNKALTVELIGTQSPRSAIGARLKATFTEAGRSRTIFRYVDTGSSFGSNPFRQSLGLGKASKVESLEVHWPMTDDTQRFTDIAASQFIRITEGSDAIEKVPLKTYRIGGK